MKSKYPLAEEYFNIEDSGEPNGDPEILRQANAECLNATKNIKADGVSVKEDQYKIEGYKGGTVELRVFSPISNDDKILPCVVNFHGGAFVGEGMPHQIQYCIQYAEKIVCRVVFVGYRTALDNPFPLPVEDCYCSLMWVMKHTETLRIDRERIAVMGDSAGGALAAAVCHMARDRAAAMPCFQMLIYPVTDSRQITESVKKYIDVPEINTKGIRLMWEMYLRNGDHGIPQYAAPLLAEHFEGLPPAYVETAEFDCLHDEGIAYAEKLEMAGVSVILNETLKTFHGYDIYQEKQLAKKAVEYRCEILKHVFGKKESREAKRS